MKDAQANHRNGWVENKKEMTKNVLAPLWCVEGRREKSNDGGGGGGERISAMNILVKCKNFYNKEINFTSMTQKYCNVAWEVKLRWQTHTHTRRGEMKMNRVSERTEKNASKTQTHIKQRNWKVQGKKPVAPHYRGRTHCRRHSMASNQAANKNNRQKHKTKATTTIEILHRKQKSQKEWMGKKREEIAFFVSSHFIS